MRTVTRSHSFPPSTFKVPEVAPEPVMRTAFQCNAYSMGQWCLPYSVPVRRLRWSHGRAT